jgi:hypothetical protein
MMRIAAHRSFGLLFERLEKSASDPLRELLCERSLAAQAALEKKHSKEISLDRAAGRIRILRAIPDLPRIVVKSVGQ